MSQGQYIPGPPPAWNTGNAIQGSMADPMQGQGQQQQQQGQQQQGFGQQRTYNYNMANEPEFVKGHQDMPHPGEDHHPPKHANNRLIQVLIVGIIIGLVIMWRLYPVASRMWDAGIGG